jgi:CheY-like chemotaxis protein
MESLASTTPQPQDHLRILVVEDDPESLQMMGALLSLWGHEPSLVSSGPPALDAFDQQSPDVVLLDLGLPGMDGFEVARKIRSRPRGGGSVLIVAVTAYRSEDHQRQAREAGFDKYLMKPVDIDTLRQVLAQAPRHPLGPKPV